MPSRRRVIAARLLACAALVLSGACGRTDLPTAQPSADEPSALISAPPRRSGLRITDLSLASTTLAINGLATTYTATIVYDGPAKSMLGVSAQAYIIQGSVSAAAGGTLVPCIPSQPGVVPQGSCTFSFTAFASNGTTSGPGAYLTRGAATFELRLYQSSGGVTRQLTGRSLAVTLVPNAPYIESVALQTTNVFVGSSMPFTITIRNPTAATQSNLGFATTFAQGAVSRAAGGSVLSCGGATGELAALASCTMSFTTMASTAAGFLEGPAIWEVRLQQGVGTSESTLDTKSVQVNLSFPIT